MVPIGLYRAEKSKGNNKPFVLLKPNAECKLNLKDKVYVLSQK